MRLKFTGNILCALLMGVVLAVLPSCNAAAAEDGIIAVVDDEVITARDLQDYMRGIFSQLRIEGRSDQEIREVMAEYQTKGVKQLIEDRLILAEANRQGMTIRPQAVEARLDEIKGRYTATGEFIAAINKEGVTISDIRKKIEDQLKAHFVVTKDVRDKIAVNPQEVTAYYTSHLDDFRKRSRLYIQSVFVKGDPGDEDVKKKVGEALAKIRSGEDFKVVADAYSELPSIGEVADDSLSPEFRTRTAAMSVGEVSDIVVTANGLYILKLTGRTSGIEPSLTEVKDDIYQKLFEIKFKENFTAWIEKLRKKSYVEIKK